MGPKPPHICHTCIAQSRPPDPLRTQWLPFCFSSCSIHLLAFRGERTATSIARGYPGFGCIRVEGAAEASGRSSGELVLSGPLQVAALVLQPFPEAQNPVESGRRSSVSFEVQTAPCLSQTHGKGWGASPPHHFFWVLGRQGAGWIFKIGPTLQNKICWTSEVAILRILFG